MTFPESALEAMEVQEAEIRRLMAKHAAIEPRGWDPIKERQALHRQIDGRLDVYLTLRAVAGLDWDPGDLHIELGVE